MGDESLITEEYKKMLGAEGEPVVFEVEKGHLKSFAKAIGDPNPLWQDEDYAGKSRYGKLISPPLAYLDLAMFPYAKEIIEAKCPVWRVLKGGIEVEYYRPIMVGDVITARVKLNSLAEKQGKGGKFLTMEIELNYTDQNGEPILKCWHRFVKR